MNNLRALLFRIGTVAVLVLVAIVMVIIGRGHTVYFDNAKIDYNGETLTGPYKVVVFVDDEQVAKLYDKERGMATNIGQTFKMRLDITQEKGGDTKSVAVTLPLPYNYDGVVINLPALLNGCAQDVYLSEFVPAATEEEATEDEEVVTDEIPVGDF